MPSLRKMLGGQNLKRSKGEAKVHHDVSLNGVLPARNAGRAKVPQKMGPDSTMSAKKLFLRDIY
jgi:hypothetical protein